MSIKIINAKPINGDDSYSLECETTHMIIRMYENEERICSFSVITSGFSSVRIVNFNMVHPYKLSRPLVRSIVEWLHSMGYMKVVFERQQKRGQFVEKEYKI